MLMDETHIPIMAWTFYHAYPVSWRVGEGLNAMKSDSVVVEEIELAYQRFDRNSLDNPVTGLALAAASKGIEAGLGAAKKGLKSVADATGASEGAGKLKNLYNKIRK